MKNIVRGKLAGAEEAVKALANLPEMLKEDLKSAALKPETVIAALSRLSASLNKREVVSACMAAGLSEDRAERLYAEAAQGLSEKAMRVKLERELGADPFSPVETEPGHYEKYVPLGVLTHIAAGNAEGLPAMSVVEGLIAGNINLLKLPGGDGGLSVLFLSRLTEIEPALAPYIYVFDISSSDVEDVKALINVSDGVAVWGSDAAVRGVRALTPPGTALIEWGHKLSFGYVTQKGAAEAALEGLARDICATEQLMCNSPQCIYYEASSREELISFAESFAQALSRVSRAYPAANLDIHAQAEITAAVELARIEEVLGEKRVIRDPSLNWSVLADYTGALAPSPQYRNVWVKPVVRENILETFRPHKDYLQTAGLSCAPEEYAQIAPLLVKAGVNRITRCGEMQGSYPGEPHDGMSALRRYVRRISYSVL